MSRTARYGLLNRDGRKIAYVKTEPKEKFFEGKMIIPEREIICSFIGLFSKEAGKEKLHWSIHNEEKYYFEQLRPGQLFVALSSELNEDDDPINSTIFRALAEAERGLTTPGNKVLGNSIATETPADSTGHSGGAAELGDDSGNGDDTDEGENEGEGEGEGSSEEEREEAGDVNNIPEIRSNVRCTCVLDNNPGVDTSDDTLVWCNRKNANIFSLFFSFYGERDLVCQYYHNGHVCNEIITFKNKSDASKNRTKSMERHFRSVHHIESIDPVNIRKMLCFDRRNVARMRPQIALLIKYNGPYIPPAKIAKIPVKIPVQNALTPTKKSYRVSRADPVLDSSAAERAFIDTARLFRKWNVPYGIFDDPEFQQWARTHMKAWGISHNDDEDLMSQ